MRVKEVVGTMTEELPGWEPSVREMQLAEQRAKGMPLTKACEAANIPYRTGQSWYPNKPEFVGLVREMRQQMVAAQHEQFGKLLELAMKFEMQVITGEVKADDPRGKLVHDI